VSDNTAEKVSKEKLEEIIEQKVEERVDKRVKEELEKHGIDKTKSSESNEDLSRRSFLKKLGASAIGLGALSIPSASALNFRSDNLQFYGGKGESNIEFKVDSIGNITASNTLNMSSNKIINLSTPSNPQDAATYKWVNNNYNNYTDSDAITAINNDSDHGNTASHSYFSGSHNDLTNIGSADHHAKYTDSEAVNAVDGMTFSNTTTFGNVAIFQSRIDAHAGAGSDIINISPNGGSGQYTIRFDDYDLRFWNNNGSSILTLQDGGGVNANTNLYERGNRVLTTADEGSGNNLDADTVDGSHASEFTTPSSTQSTRDTTGRLSGFDYPVSDNSSFYDVGGVGGQYHIKIFENLSEVYVMNGGPGSIDYSIHHPDGTNTTGSVSDAKWQSVNDYVTHISFTDASLRVKGVNIITSGNHSHPI